MDKLYTPLHTAAIYFKKQFLSNVILLIATVALHVNMHAQCIPPPAPVITPNPAFMCLTDPPVMLRNGPQPFCSGTVNITVPDNNPAGASNTIVVTGIPPACTINSMSVTINMTHSWIGDMVFVLKAPNGQIVNLDWHLSGTWGIGGGTGFLNTVISTVALTPLSAGINPYSGTYKPDAVATSGGIFGAAGPTGMLPTTSNWSSLLSVPNGTWTLGFYDGVTGETGTLNSWCIDFNFNCSVGSYPSSPAVWSPFTGLFADPAAAIPYTGVAANTVYAKPLPAGTYVYSATVQNLPAPFVVFSNPSAITIPVGGAATPYSSNITVSGLPATGVKVGAVVLNGFNHTKSEDADIILQSPSGQNVILMSDAGSGNTGNVTYTFADNGSFMTATAPNATGTYRPANWGVPDDFPAPGPGSITQTAPALAQFTGNLNGTWKLFVVDDDGTAGQGTIAGGYTINFDTTTYCTSQPGFVTVVVGVPTTITTQPGDQNICIGKNAYFTVGATGGALTYQWQTTTNGGVTWTNLLNAGLYSGVNTATLTITTPPVSMSGSRYKVVINGSSGCSAVTSQPATLTVNTLPTVSFYPHPYHLLLPGLSTTLSSTVSPTAAATYTWLHNGVAVPGATTDTLLVDFNNIGLYQLSVTDVNGCTGISDTISIRDSALGRMFIYPNPTNGVFQVRMYSTPNTSLPRSLIVYNNMGNKVVTTSYNQTVSYQKIYVDIRRNGKGLYWVEVVDKDGKRMSISKVLIQ